MKMSLVDWRKVWWELIDSRQPTDLPAKPTDGQVIKQYTELRYGNNETRYNQIRGLGNSKVR